MLDWIRLFLHHRLVRAALVAVAATQLGACGGMVRLAYNNGDFAVRYAADDYFSLDSDQLDLLRPQVAKFHAWHRRAELPRYANLATSAVERLERGVTTDDVTWAIQNVRGRYRVLAAQAVDDAAPLLASLNPENIVALEKKLAASTLKLEREYQARDEATRLANRATAVRKRIEEWLGSLSPAQEALLQQYARNSPQFSTDRFAERRKRQQVFVQLLREHRGTPELAPKLKAFFVESEAQRSPAEAIRMREWEQSIARLVVDMDRVATPEQRTRVVQRVARYAEDFRVLSGGTVNTPVANAEGVR
jgi:Family of unknown function (DUF6279)